MQIYLYHGEAYGNLGDEAMLVNAIERIQRAIGPCEFLIHKAKGASLPRSLNSYSVITCPSPRQFLSTMHNRLFGNRYARFLGLNKILSQQYLWTITPFLLRNFDLMLSKNARKAWRDFKQSVKNCDAVYIVGDANLNDFAGPQYILPKLVLIDVAYKFNIPVIVSAQAIGPIWKHRTKKLLRKSVRRASYFSLRDIGISEKLLIQLGAPKEKLRTVGDEAFTLPMTTTHKTCTFLNNCGVNCDRPFGLIHFRSTDYIANTKRHYRKLAEAIDQLPCDWQIIFLPMSYHHHSTNDVDCGKAIRGLLKSHERFVVLSPILDPFLARRIVDLSSWIISLSYHVQIFAISSTVPFVMLSSGSYYRTKALGVQGWTGKGTKLLDLDTSDVQKIVESIKHLVFAREQHISQLRNVRDSILKVNSDPIKALQRVLLHHSS